MWIPKLIWDTEELKHKTKPNEVICLSEKLPTPTAYHVPQQNNIGNIICKILPLKNLYNMQLYEIIKYIWCFTIQRVFSY